MGKFIKILVLLAVIGALGIAGVKWYMETADSREVSRVAFNEYCADCHANDLSGTAKGPALIGVRLQGGDSSEGLIASIIKAHHKGEAPPWQEELSNTMIKALALFISERRQQFPTTFKSYETTNTDQQVSSQYYSFRSELVTELTSRPYSMAALPDGRFLIAEKTRGLSIVDQAGQQGELIKDTPKVWKELLSFSNMQFVLGTMLDIALHPDYESNGWVYLSHADRCQLDCGLPWPVSMVKVVRGRIKNGAWVDNEVIWSVPYDFYTVAPDNVACGRLAFDKENHLYITVGGKWTYDNLHKMDTPYGKIHRVKDDGSVPEDNPFWQHEKVRANPSTQHTVWSYGHRTTQGLASHPRSGEIWSTEMGPRGGDEVNRIERGGNYGWPLYTNGLDYDSTPITIGKDLGLDFPIEETVLPIVDFTPAPAVSNLTFHHGDKFPLWEDDLLMGSLKAQTLYRLRIKAGKLIEQEKLLTDLGRIRDVEMGADGFVYVVIEHGDKGSLVRLSPNIPP